MSMVLFFSMAYVALNEDSKNSNHFLGLAAILSTVGYFCLRFQGSEIFTIASYLKDLQHVSIFLFYSFSFSPVLYKLTDTISSKSLHIVVRFCNTHLELNLYNLCGPLCCIMKSPKLHPKYLGDETLKMSQLSELCH